MTFFPPVGPFGQPVGPPPAYQVPPGRSEDRQEQQPSPPPGPRRPGLSTTQILLGVLLVLLIVGILAFLITGEGESRPEGTILNPSPNARLAPGEIEIRIRVTAADKYLAGNSPATWELAVADAKAPDEWRVIASGDAPVIPRIPPSGVTRSTLLKPAPTSCDSW